MQTCGERILFLTGLGSTETAPFAMSRMWESDKATNMGLPARGTELKLVPSDGKLEARFKGPHITPGLLAPAGTDREGLRRGRLLRIGDALKFEDESDPLQGLLFDGRIAEDFKLGSGTWVSCGPLRAAFIDHFKPYVRDVVIAGGDREYVAVLDLPRSRSLPARSRRICRRPRHPPKS